MDQLGVLDSLQTRGKDDLGNNEDGMNDSVTSNDNSRPNTPQASGDTDTGGRPLAVTGFKHLYAKYSSEKAERLRPSDQSPVGTEEKMEKCRNCYSYRNSLQTIWECQNSQYSTKKSIPGENR
ncbi:hypothetical protein OUZ56_012556 [Daphnia magna]|uniref:Uncharacterized protein n=1 Tax=Daphnia magna TaxID=35525 RepID=A0ABQ9Z3D3_9CRUS|nr:hypothetical protein OUZ56_012556 [Daphnia magna]